MTRRSSTLLILFIWFATFACSGGPQQEIKKATQSAQSWAASISLIGETWNIQAAPPNATQKALKESRKAVEKEIEKVQSAKIPAEAKQKIVAWFQQTKQITEELQKAVEQEDRGTAQKLISQLKNLASEVKSQKQSS
jgi:predicted HTH transcriptional regulator